MPSGAWVSWVPSAYLLGASWVPPGCLLSLSPASRCPRWLQMLADGSRCLQMAQDPVRSCTVIAFPVQSGPSLVQSQSSPIHSSPVLVQASPVQSQSSPFQSSLVPMQSSPSPVQSQMSPVQPQFTPGQSSTFANAIQQNRQTETT